MKKPYEFFLNGMNRRTLKYYNIIDYNEIIKKHYPVTAKDYSLVKNFNFMCLLCKKKEAT